MREQLSVLSRFREETDPDVNLDFTLNNRKIFFL